MKKIQFLTIIGLFSCLCAYGLISAPVQINTTSFHNEPDGIGQSFIMPEAAWITGIQLKMKNLGNYNPVNCRIDLQNYTNEAIFSAALRSVELSSNTIPSEIADWVYIQFDTPYRAQKYQELAWVYKKYQIGNTIGLSEGNPYKEGARFRRYSDGTIGISTELDFAFIVEYANKIPGYDSDGDGLPDSWEVLHGLDPKSDLFGENADMEGDGYTNKQELEGHTHPLNADTDNDGLPDGWEGSYNLNPLLNDSKSDTDADGSTALEEFTFGTCPTNSGDFFYFDTVTFTQEINNVIIEWSTPNEVDHYYLDHSDTLEPNSWIINPTKIFNLSTITSLTIPSTTNTCRFYRVRAYRNPSYLGALAE